MQSEMHTTLAELALAHPAASRVFHRHGLDFCCGGDRAIADACSERGLDPRVVLAEIAAEEGGQERRWDTRPLPEIVEHIVKHYHRRLRLELPELVALADKVERRHGDKASCPRGLHAHLVEVHQSLLQHMMKEEQVLFPMISAGHGRGAAMPIHVMQQEHDEHAEGLRRTRELTADFTLPPDACTSWQALYLLLAELERELMEHIHLENHLLFPRALRE